MHLKKNLVLPSITAKDATRIFLVSLLIFFSWPHSLYYKLGAGLDYSWMVAIHMAIEKNLVFGKDILFTYGPLGFLAIRLPIGISAFSYLLFDLYVLANLFFVFDYLLKKHDLFISFLFIFLNIILLQDFHDHDILMVLTWLQMFMLFYHFESGKFYALFNAGVLTLAVFFIKVNLGLVVLFIMGAYLCLIYLNKRRKMYLFFAAGFSVALLMCSLLLNVSLGSYIEGSLHLISAYNDSMYATLHKPMSNPSLIAAVFMLTLMGFIIVWHNKPIRAKPFLLFGCFTMLLLTYVNFKQGYVRLHTESFFQYVTPIFSLLFLFSQGPLQKSVYKALVIMLFISFLNQGKLEMLFSHELLQGKLTHVRTYVHQLLHYNDSKQELEEAGVTEQIPKSVVSKVNGSADIIPFDVAYLFYNHLEYNPRPVIQSYAAYDSYLDLQNANKYSSTSDPKFVLAKPATIDNRYFLHDETKTKLELLRRYDVINSEWTHLLLERLPNPLSMEEAKYKEGFGVVSRFELVDNSKELQVASFDVNYSLLGKMMRLLFQPPQLFISVITEGGKKYDFRAVTTILKGGVIINKFVPSAYGLQDLSVFLAGNGEFSENIVSYKLWSPDSWGFKSDFSYSIEKVSFQGEKKSANSLKQVARSSPSISNNLTFNIEKISSNNTISTISGWAFPTGQNSSHSETFVILKSSTKDYVFPCEMITRGDVSAYFRKDSLDESGFQSTILNNLVEDGDYDIGLIIDKEKRSSLQYIGKKISFRRDKQEGLRRDLWEEDPIKYFVDNFSEDDATLTVQGWAFRESGDNSALNISIVLESDYAVNLFPAARVQRKDLNSFFHRTDLVDAGFDIRIDKQKLKPGSYKIGILLEKDAKRTFVITDKNATVK